jgi:hypothetical protein
MDGGFGILLIAALAVVAVTVVVLRRNAARVRWAAEFWLAGREKTLSYETTFETNSSNFPPGPRGISPSR